MAKFKRSNAWKNGGNFGNADLLWYAIGVGVMQSRTLDDPNSWWFFAAIHGHYVTGKRKSFPSWAAIQSPPSVPTSPLPAKAVQRIYWNQCQHQTWFFPPWHRGYLIALEEQVRAAIVAQGGPASWALPYWNYLGPNSEQEIPPAFSEKKLPNGSPNPLYVTERYGPNGDRHIFVPIPPVSKACLSNNLYTGSNAVTPRPGFGGPITKFTHGGGTSGNLENNPHNLVHVDVGGDAPNGQSYGLMSDPGLAALDPIFYIHHCNIDRIWAIWNANGNANPTDSKWLKGPAASGGRDFAVPMPNGVKWVYTPAQMTDLNQLDYTYDDLPSTPAPAPPVHPMIARLQHLGVKIPSTPHVKVVTMHREQKSRLLGTHDGALPIKSSGARAAIRLNSSERRKLTQNLMAASTTAPPDRTYLRLENVRGTRDAHKLDVYVNDHLAGTIALFGVSRASLKDGSHGGAGLTFELDITQIVDTLHIQKALEQNQLDVRIVPTRNIPDGADITVGRVSVYRETI